MGKVINLINLKFGRLTVIKQGKTGNHRQLYWVCNCDCGTKAVEINGSSLRKGITSSCGCYQREIVSKLNTGNQYCKTHGMINTSEYTTWAGIKDRCNNQNNAAYKNYGGRGITVCDRWRDSFENFYEDMGPRPSDKHSIDRINNNGNYELCNCRWTTQLEQLRNTRRVIIESLVQANEIRTKYKTRNYTQQELANEYNCSRSNINEIVNNRTWKN